jgi:hypothetical protein
MTQVGSIKMGHVNYPKNEVFFQPEETVPKEVRMIAKEIRHSIIPDTLGTRSKKWDQQVLVDNDKRTSSSLKQTLLDIRHGLKDEKVAGLKDKTPYPGTDTRNVYHDKWEVSVQQPTPKKVYRAIAE